MRVCDSSRKMGAAKPLGLPATILIVCGVVLAAPAVADRNQCAPAGVDSATALPADMTETEGVGEEDPYTTPTVEPLSSVNIGELGLGTPGVLNVGTLSDAPPSICIDATGQFSGFDNQFLNCVCRRLRRPTF